MDKNIINLDDIKIEFVGSSARVEHVPTGIFATQSSNDNQIINYTEAFLLLMARMENHKSIRVKSSSYKPSLKFIEYESEKSAINY